VSEFAVVNSSESRCSTALLGAAWNSPAVAPFVVAAVTKGESPAHRRCRDCVLRGFFGIGAELFHCASASPPIPCAAGRASRAGTSRDVAGTNHSSHIRGFMATIHWALPVVVLLQVTIAAPALADSSTGGTSHGTGLALPVWGDAPPMADGFNYPAAGFFPAVPAPWQFSAVSGSSYNYLYDVDGVEDLVLNYSGSGSYTLWRGDMQGTNAIYQIDFLDDGTQDLGELFYVADSTGDFIGIGVNNSVANGYYYQRVAAVPGNKGTPILAPRNGRASNNNWHTFSIFVSSSGSVAIVDGVESTWYPNLTSVQLVQLMGNWSKPANTVVVDNFVVTPFTNLPPGNIVSAPAGQTYNPYGGPELLTMFADDWANLYASNENSWWRNGYPNRSTVVNIAIQEGDRALCGGTAQSKYLASGEWCSEFARWVLMQSGSTDPFLLEVSTTQQLVSQYQTFSAYTPRASVTPGTAHPGDFLSLISGSTGSSNGHSAIIVGVSTDSRYLWTVEGNVNSGPNTPSCVMYGHRDYFVNGVLNPDIDGIGNTDLMPH
jgi:hypothetical protein